MCSYYIVSTRHGKVAKVWAECEAGDYVVASAATAAGAFRHSN